MNRIAVHRVCGVGDAAQITPLLRQIRDDFPQAHVTCFTSENAAPVLRGAPWIDELISMRKSTVTPGWRNPGGIRMWWQIGMHGRFDLFLHLGARWRDSIASVCVRAKVRAGLSTASSWLPKPFQFIEALPADPLQDQIHASQHYLDLWCRITGKADRGHSTALPHLGLSTDVSRWHLPSRSIAIAPGSGNWLNPAPSKRWPPSFWREFMLQAISEGFTPLLLGVHEDFPPDQIPAKALSLLGEVTLEETAAVLRRCYGFAGHDSGLFHMALALGVPSAAFFGPTRPELTGPFRQPRSLVLRHTLPCAPCCSTVCRRPYAPLLDVEGSPLCLSSISPTAAWSQFLAFLTS